MRELNSEELLAVSGGGRTCGGGNRSNNPAVIGAVTASLSAQFQSDFSEFLRMDDFSREDFAALVPQGDWPALEALYDQVIADRNGR